MKYSYTVWLHGSLWKFWRKGQNEFNLWSLWWKLCTYFSSYTFPLSDKCLLDLMRVASKVNNGNLVCIWMPGGSEVWCRHTAEATLLPSNVPRFALYFTAIQYLSSQAFYRATQMPYSHVASCLKNLVNWIFFGNFLWLLSIHF